MRLQIHQLLLCEVQDVQAGREDVRVQLRTRSEKGRGARDASADLTERLISVRAITRVGAAALRPPFEKARATESDPRIESRIELRGTRMRQRAGIWFAGFRARLAEFAVEPESRDYAIAKIGKGRD